MSSQSIRGSPLCAPVIPWKEAQPAEFEIYLQLREMYTLKELSEHSSRPCSPLQIELWRRDAVAVCQFANVIACTLLMSLCSIAWEMHQVCRGPSASTLGRHHRITGTEARTRVYKGSDLQQIQVSHSRSPTCLPHCESSWTLLGQLSGFRRAAAASSCASPRQFSHQLFHHSSPFFPL